MACRRLFCPSRGLPERPRGRLWRPGNVFFGLFSPENATLALLWGMEGRIFAAKNKDDENENGSCLAEKTTRFTRFRPPQAGQENIKNENKNKKPQKNEKKTLQNKKVLYICMLITIRQNRRRMYGKSYDNSRLRRNFRWECCACFHRFLVGGTRFYQQMNVEKTAQEEA